jgi:hypothetical protein
LPRCVCVARRHVCMCMVRRSPTFLGLVPHLHFLVLCLTYISWSCVQNVDSKNLIKGRIAVLTDSSCVDNKVRNISSEMFLVCVDHSVRGCGCGVGVGVHVRGGVFPCTYKCVFKKWQMLLNGKGSSPFPCMYACMHTCIYQHMRVCIAAKILLFLLCVCVCATHGVHEISCSNPIHAQ